jgi:glycosyltransferase involved in cell wall biosynthesis
MTREPIRVLREIAGLNIGGPAIQAISLTALMQDRGCSTRLVRGSESADEGARLGVGFLRDVPDVCFASDVVALTSDREGTPVSLIEAQVAAVRVVSTSVGDVRSVAVDGKTGHLADGPANIAARIGPILDDREGDDLDRLYRRLLA